MMVFAVILSGGKGRQPGTPGRVGMLRPSPCPTSLGGSSPLPSSSLNNSVQSLQQRDGDVVIEQNNQMASQ